MWLQPREVTPRGRNVQEHGRGRKVSAPDCTAEELPWTPPQTGRVPRPRACAAGRTTGRVPGRAGVVLLALAVLLRPLKPATLISRRPTWYQRAHEQTRSERCESRSLCTSLSGDRRRVLEAHLSLVCRVSPAARMYPSPRGGVCWDAPLLLQTIRGRHWCRRDWGAPDAL